MGYCCKAEMTMFVTVRFGGECAFGHFWGMNQRGIGTISRARSFPLVCQSLCPASCPTALKPGLNGTTLCLRMSTCIVSPEKVSFTRRKNIFSDESHCFKMRTFRYRVISFSQSTPVSCRQLSSIFRSFRTTSRFMANFREQ